MTPFEIKILLHYHVCCDDYPGGLEVPFLAHTIDRFVTDGVLAENPLGEAKFEMTERGHAYCRALQSVQLPESRWVMTWPEPEVVK